MGKRVRLPYAAKRHVETAMDGIMIARKLAREIRADLSNPDNVTLAREKLADIQTELADAQRFIDKALEGGFDDEED